MTQTTQYDNPNDIDSLSTLKIKAVSGNLSPSIYANGRNQLPIQITVKAVNKAGNPLKFSNETWISILNLRFAESDKKLNRKGSSGWCFTEVENEYSKEIQPGSHRSKRFLIGEDGKAIIIMYVYTDDTNTKRIAVSVDTDNGKHFTTADSPSGAEEMSVTINAFQALNYADRANLSIEPGDFIQISSNLGWRYQNLIPGSREIEKTVDFYNGTCKRRIIKIYPKNYDRKFKKHEIIYSPITDKDVSSTIKLYPKGGYAYDDNSFALIHRSKGYPCAVIGWGLYRDDYQVNLLFSSKNHINIDGYCYFWRHDKIYRFYAYVNENHFNDADEGVPTLILYKFTLPESRVCQHYWHDVIRNPTVNVTDSYGNTGTFQLTFDDKEHFDIPGIV